MNAPPKAGSGPSCPRDPRTMESDGPGDSTPPRAVQGLKTGGLTKYDIAEEIWALADKLADQRQAFNRRDLSETLREMAARVMEASDG